MAGAGRLEGGDDLKENDVVTNGISLHVTEQGEGPAVLFCHGFPDTSYTWRRQMKAVASAGYRAIAPDMRGYGRSSAPADPTLYTPLHTTGDLVGLLDALTISSAVLVGHDWGATHAWNAALMRPDRFTAAFCLSVPYVPRGDISVFESMRAAGRQDDFYMFEQIRPEAVGDLLQILRRHYNFIVVDVPSHATPFNRAFLDMADQHVLVMDGSLAAIRDTLRFFEVSRPT